MSKLSRLCAALVLGLLAAPAMASTVSFTEGNRPVVPGSTPVVPIDAAAVPPGFNLGMLVDNGDIIELFGRIVASQDVFTVTTLKPMKVDLLAFTPDQQMTAKESIFSLSRDGMDIVSASVMTSEAPLRLALALPPGTYIFTVDGASSTLDALYDVRFTAVPVPAGLGLLAAAMIGIAYLGARNRKLSANV